MKHYTDGTALLCVHIYVPPTQRDNQIISEKKERRKKKRRQMGAAAIDVERRLAAQPRLYCTRGVVVVPTP